MKFCLWFRTFVFLIVSFFSSFSVWASSNPLNMLQTISGQMISDLKSNKANLRSNPEITYNIINGLLLSHVDTLGMSKAVLGQTVWMRASPTERTQFTQEFIRLLVRTYANAFSNYDNQEVKFFPIRNNNDLLTDRIQINSVILQADGPKIPVNYRLAKINDDWKIYDINVDDVSLLQSYRAQFAAELARGGFKELLEKLKKS